LCATGDSFLYWLYVHNVLGHARWRYLDSLCYLTLDAAVSMNPPVTGAKACFLADGHCIRFFTGRILWPVAMKRSQVTMGASFPVSCPDRDGEYRCGHCCVYPLLLRHGGCFEYFIASDAETMALRDPLTNLPNRRLFLDRLQEAEARAPD